MIELGVFHNGASDLPVTITADGVAINAGDLRTTQEAAVRTQIDQIRQGVLAEQLGFDYFFLTEHHFQPEGAEDSPNPIQTQTAIAALTQAHPARSDGEHPHVAPPGPPRRAGGDPRRGVRGTARVRARPRLPAA